MGFLIVAIIIAVRLEDLSDFQNQEDSASDSMCYKNFSFRYLPITVRLTAGDRFLPAHSLENIRQYQYPLTIPILELSSAPLASSCPQTIPLAPSYLCWCFFMGVEGRVRMDVAELGVESLRGIQTDRLLLSRWGRNLHFLDIALATTTKPIAGRWRWWHVE